MKKHKLLIISIAVLVVAGTSVALAGNNLQGLIFKFNPKTIQKVDPKILNYKIDPCKQTPSLCTLFNPVPPIYPMDDEQEITPVIYKDGTLTSVVPIGYELLGKKTLEDLKNCWNLIPKWLGITPYYNGAIVKWYISKNGNQPGLYATKGLILYGLSKDTLDANLKATTNNDPNNFFYNSSPTYCSNAHEFTHLVVDKHSLPKWANEGIAVYSQDINQNDGSPRLDCREDGIFQKDWWTDDKEKLFPYSDLTKVYDPSSDSGTAIWYNSAGCFWKMFNQKYGTNIFKKVFTEVGKVNNLTSMPNGVTTYLLNEIMFKVVDNTDDLQSLLKKFGFVKGVNY